MPVEATGGGTDVLEGGLVIDGLQLCNAMTRAVIAPMRLVPRGEHRLEGHPPRTLLFLVRRFGVSVLGGTVHSRMLVVLCQRRPPPPIAPLWCSLRPSDARAQRYEPNRRADTYREVWREITVPCGRGGGGGGGGGGAWATTQVLDGASYTVPYPHSVALLTAGQTIVVAANGANTVATAIAFRRLLVAIIAGLPTSSRPCSKSIVELCGRRRSAMGVFRFKIGAGFL